MFYTAIHNFAGHHQYFYIRIYVSKISNWNSLPVAWMSLKPALWLA
jgi:hypothetical protein